MTDVTQVPSVPAELRATIARELTPVRPLRPPVVRVLATLPLAMILLVAAPTVFFMRDPAGLGWIGTWGASLLQTIAGVGIVAAALRDAVPGRRWDAAALGAMLMAAVGLMLAITFVSWSANPVTIRTDWLEIGALCFGSSLASALPAVAFGAVLTARAYPTRPFVSGSVAGFGAGLMADAGWRLFCHYSDPAHVLPAHLGGIVVAAVIGGAITWALVRRLRG